MEKKVVGTAKTVGGQYMIDIKAYATGGDAVVGAFIKETEIGRGTLTIEAWSDLAKENRVSAVQSLGGIFAAEPIAIKAAIKLQEAVENLAARSRQPAAGDGQSNAADAASQPGTGEPLPAAGQARPADAGAKVALSRGARELLLYSAGGAVSVEPSDEAEAGHLAELREAGFVESDSPSLTEAGRRLAGKMQEKFRLLQHGVPLAEITLAGAPVAESFLVGQVEGRAVFSDNHLLIEGDCPGEVMNDRVDMSKVDFEALWRRAWENEQSSICPVAFAVVDGGKFVFFDNGAAMTYDQYVFVRDRFEGVEFTQSSADSFINLHAGSRRVGLVIGARAEAPEGVSEIIRNLRSEALRKTA